MKKKNVWVRRDATVSLTFENDREVEVIPYEKWRDDETAKAQQRAARLAVAVPPNWDKLASVTARQAAAILRVHERTVSNWVRKGKLTRTPRGRITTASIRAL